jgi:hypothetical protein
VTDPLRVYVNAEGVNVANGASALDAVRAWRGDEAEAVASGKRVITDSRGLPIDAATPARAGSIYRTVTSRPERDA